MDSIVNKHIKTNGEFEHFSKSITSLQAIGIFGAIIYHVDPRFILYMTIGADFYSFLSGLLLTVILLRKTSKDHSWNQWYKNRVIRIYPIIILSTLFILSYRFITARRVFELDSILVHISGFQALPGVPEYFSIDGPHWFITLILTCYLLFPIFFALIKKNFKFVAILGFFLYALYVPFSYNIVIALENLIYILLRKNVILIALNGYIPRYFCFFFGIVLGFWIEKNESANLKIFRENKNGILFFISLIILITSYLMYLFFVFNIADENTFAYYFEFRVFFQPFITISFVCFFIYLCNRKNIINKILKFPGKEAYEIIMIHTIGMLIVLYLIFNIFSFMNYDINIIISIILIFILSIIIAYPIYYMGNWLKNNKKFHDTIVIIALSLIFFTIIIYINLILDLFVLNNVYSFLLYCSILIILILLTSFRTFINKLKIFRITIQLKK